jgi:hypothetical protein
LKEREEGCGWQKKIEEGVMGKTTLLPPHHRIVPDRNRGGGTVSLAGSGASASRHGGGGGVGKRREEVEGNPFLSSPRVETAHGRRSTAAGVPGGGGLLGAGELGSKGRGG